MRGSRHTPGPWPHNWQFIVAPDPAGIHPDIYIAEIVDTDDEGRMAAPKQQDANANLIAAAPALLEAALLIIERWSQGDLAEAVRMLDDAVAEATGGASWARPGSSRSTAGAISGVTSSGFAGSSGRPLRKRSSLRFFNSKRTAARSNDRTAAGRYREPSLFSQ